jgi:hypothetical protein
MYIYIYIYIYYGEQDTPWDLSKGLAAGPFGIIDRYDSAHIQVPLYASAQTVSIHMCPHQTGSICVSILTATTARTYRSLSICVRILRCMCPHTTICVRIRLYLCAALA